MAINLFERTEKKYVLDYATYSDLLQRIGGYLKDDAFPRSTVSSLYYDDDLNTMINRSNEKPLYKEKLRLRSYGPVGPHDAVFVELKKKFKGITYKRRMQLAREDAYAYFTGRCTYEASVTHSRAVGLALKDAFDWQTTQTVREIDATLARYENLAPRQMIVVDRLAKRTNDGSDVRITFDLNARWRAWNLGFEFGTTGNALFPDGRVIMEIKANAAYPLWLVHTLNELKIYPQPCSKVGIAYTRATAETGIQKEAYCA